MPNFVPLQSTDFACEILARRAAALLQNPSTANDEVALQNIYRLLEMYRYDEFVDVAPRGVLALEQGSSMVDESDVEADTLKRALDAAREEAYPGQTKASVVDALEGLVKAIAQQAGEMRDAASARNFFELLARNLQRG